MLVVEDEEDEEWLSFEEAALAEGGRGGSGSGVFPPAAEPP